MFCAASGGRAAPQAAGEMPALHFTTVSAKNQEMQVSLREANSPADLRIIAKDGADLRSGQLMPLPNFPEELAQLSRF
jgi:hypothetical protein